MVKNPLGPTAAAMPAMSVAFVLFGPPDRRAGTHRERTAARNLCLIFCDACCCFLLTDIV